MSRRPSARFASALLVIGLAVPTAAVPAADDAPVALAIGAEAPDFTLPGVDGKSYSLASFASSPVLVVIFTAVHCPTAEVYEARLKQLVAEYQPKGVAFVAIQPNSAKALRLDEMGYTDLGDSLDDMKTRAAHRQFNFPFLYDGDTQETSRKYGPTATPHVFVFDKARRLRYQGRVDSNPREAYAKVPDTRLRDRRAAGGHRPPGREDADRGLLGEVALEVDAARRRAEGDRAGGGAAREDRRRGHHGAAAERHRQDDPGELLGNVVRAVHGRVPRAADDLPDVPQAPVRSGHRRHQLPGRGEGRAALPRIAARLVAQLSCRRRWIRTSSSRPSTPSGTVRVPFSMLIAPGGKVLMKTSGVIEPLKTRRAILASFPDDDYVGQNAYWNQK